jgi:hypothetical protein
MSQQPSEAENPIINGQLKTPDEPSDFVVSLFDDPTPQVRAWFLKTLPLFGFLSGDDCPKLTIIEFSISVRAVGVHVGAVEVDARMEPGCGRKGGPPEGWFLGGTRFSPGTLHAYCPGVDAAGAPF